jgi:DNA topoisomerase-1
MTLGHKRILTNLTKNGSYKTYCIEIIERKRFKPFEGRKKDAAHPAIHPTGNLIGENLSLNEKKLYDLIVKRYLAVFGERAKQVNKNIVININSHHFEIRGSHIVKEGWIKYYKTYVSYLDISIPDLKLGEKIFFNFINEKEHFTEPTRRFNESTLLKMMEDEQIGTKATRAGIIKTLFGRGYVVGSVIKPTPLGIAVIEVLQKHYPIIVKPDMTRNLELLMENVQEEKTSVDEAILSKKKELKDMLLEFHKKESEIGIALNMNLLTSEKKSFINLGACPECKVGELRIIHSKKTGKRFIACSSYKNSSIKCEVTYPLPPYGEINRTNKICQFDGLPLMEWKRGRKKEHVCIDFHCLSRKEVGKNGNKTE